MKPPILVASLTEEDLRIWTRPARYAYDGSFFLARHQDRRDHLVMLMFEVDRNIGMERDARNEIRAVSS